MARTTTILILLLLAAGVGAHAGEKEEALWDAARSGDVATVKKLLEEGVDPNAANRYGATALFFASDKGHGEVVAVLLDHGADVNVQDTFYGASALTWAVSNGRTEVLRLLLQHGAQGAGSALAGAARDGDLEIARVLVELGKPTDEELSVALAVAERPIEDEDAAKKAAAMAAFLKESGAEPPPEANFEIPAATLARYAGTYENSDGNALILEVQDGRLHASFGGGNVFPLGAVDAVTFQPAGIPGVQLTLTLPEEGEGPPTGLTFKRGAQEIPFTRAASEEESNASEGGDS